MLQRRTIAREIQIQGIGLQTGVLQRLVLKPAKAGHGIIFHHISSRGDRGHTEAHYMNLKENNSMVFLENKFSNHPYKSVEHLMGLLYAFRITDLLIGIDGTEVPAENLEIAEKLLTNIRSLNSYYTPARFHQSTFSQGNSSITYVPTEGLIVNCYFEFQEIFSGYKTYKLDEFSSFNYLSDARTFCEVNHLLALQNRGLAKGVSEKNCIVLSHDSIFSEDTVEECIRHKILDFLGDLYLSGRIYEGCFLLKNPSHKFTHSFIKSNNGE